MYTLTNRNTRLAALMVAVGVTALINGTVVWKFDVVAQHHAALQNAQTEAVQVTLERVTIVAPRS
ncbi:MAG: hypothetical protein IPO19_16910 [Rhodoferax sp.]|nr:hypothetical protein [Rhodoferax sp.]MBK9237569.1 hypothetical protein [Rhodoferax sp.]